MQIRHTPMEVRQSNVSEFSAPKIGADSGTVVVGVVDSSTIVKKPVTATLRSLSVGESADFPIEQRTSALVVANRLKKELARIGWDYKYYDDEDNFIVKILRTV